MAQRSINAPAHADAGTQLTQQLVGITKYGDVRNPIIYGAVAAPKLAQGLVANVYRLRESSQRQDGLFEVDFGNLQMVWLLHSTGTQSCASFFTLKAFDPTSAATILRNLIDSLQGVAAALGCTVDFASDGQVDGGAATIIEGGRTMLVSELFG